jgi:hypothetical protein
MPGAPRVSRRAVAVVVSWERDSTITRRYAMINLVIWSFALALIPLTMSIVHLTTAALSRWLASPLEAVEANRMA